LNGASSRRAYLVVATAAAAVLASSAGRLVAQAMTVNVAGDVLHVKAPDFHFLTGEALSRLKDGRAVRFDFDLLLLTEPKGAAVRQSRESFNLSYDLWEERFAVTRISTPARSTSHLTQANAEAWCLEQLTLPVSAFGRLGRDAPFWLRLAYRVVERQGQTGSKPKEGFTIWGLVDILGRQGRTETSEASLEAGPFRLPD
jgi:hypothetical protein